MDFGPFLHDRIESGGFTTEDALASFLPLLRQVVHAHQHGLVAPLEGLGQLHVEGTQIWFAEAGLVKPRTNAARVAQLLKSRSRGVEIVGEARVTDEVHEGDETITNLAVGERGREIERPVYLPGYVSWEHEIGHHDPLTDVFSLGMIIASLGCELDFRHRDDLAAFVEQRNNLFALNARLHPVLARAIANMTQLDRHKRPQDLAAVLSNLENYRDQSVDLDLELARSGIFEQADPKSRQEMILTTLQQRLFEISRRNRLLHFRTTMQTVNLTLASVPLAFAAESIRAEEILTWNRDFQSRLAEGEAIALNRHLRFEEAVYLPGALDRIIGEARREKAEFGSDQLRLVACFLRWSNLKVKPHERFDSPLVLVPVRLTKKKGVRDSWLLEATGNEAEINPVLRHYLKQLYDLDLPERLDLTSSTLDELHAFLAAKIRASEPAVEVEKVERPRIKIMHALARRRLDQYWRRVRISGRGVRSLGDIDYSYEPENFHPLGLLLFQARVKAPTTDLATIVEDQPRARSFAIPPAPPAVEPGIEAEPSVEKKKKLYALIEDEGNNPYHWEFDLCSVTLGSFRYRKLSLVRDYQALLENRLQSPVCEAIFSREPRPVDLQQCEAPQSANISLPERYDVVSCDPTQGSAITRARGGESYIIQGPPGTGKSQTITNLIADFLGQGKRVLFVCEKRAAIDVVYHRLHSTGLSRLCCLIHDSQLDKREFILDLKQTYDELLEEGPSKKNNPHELRKRVLGEIDRELAPLQRFHDSLCAVPAAAGIPVHRLLKQSTSLRPYHVTLSLADAERVPNYALWQAHADHISSFAEALRQIQPDGVFINHQLRLCSVNLVQEERPVERVTGALTQAADLLGRIEQMLASCGPAAKADTIAAASAVRDYVDRVAALARNNVLTLLEASSGETKRLTAVLKKRRAAIKRLDEARQRAAGWKQPLSPADATVALAQAVEFDKSWLKVLSPSWWRLRSVLYSSYDFASHAVKPSWVLVIGWLYEQYEAQAAVDKIESEAREEFGFEGPLGEFVEELGDLRSSVETWPAVVQELHRHCLTLSDAGPLIGSLAGLNGALEQLAAALAGVLETYEQRPFAELKRDFDTIKSSLHRLPDFLFCLAALARLPPEFARALRTLPLDLAQLEAASAERTLEQVFRAEPDLDRFDGRVRQQHVERLNQAIGRWREANSGVVVESVRARFHEHVRIASLPAGQLRTDEKEFKKQYQRGRRELEHEFGKTTRYRSIRDLASDETGMVIRDLKPVWLMSPLSVSDTLPLDTGQFDVVIFDEASQITLEEAIPTVFRGVQTIVVGDKMQLPPTNFFSAKHSEDEDTLQYEEEPGQIVEYDLSSDSLLEHASRNLSSTMLGWHYRSRSESLISFSNAAFYKGRLLTVPEESLARADRAPIVAAAPDAGKANIDRLLDRPVSFHFLENGIYRGRKNSSEAEYIAELVRALLVGKSGRSIGIIAFSEAQQGEINDALARLARDDREFRELYEAELEREENDQFLGLLVKNLENIQGDERDVVILSICYGYDANRKMLMNFGPINQSGGERRLNVAFSRARHHMAVVSSIRNHDITNDYNDGANCLKNYLRYAEAMSAGDFPAARRVLSGYSAATEAGNGAPADEADPVVDQLAAALTERGWKVDRQVGQSNLRCDLAIYRDGDAQYRLGILVDTEAYYRQPDVLEKDLMRPKLLEDFGWKITHVLSKDWHRQPEAVLESLQSLLAPV
ncbi:MAG TPA: AAA domain-containing protein [Planctomycetaceae bacterium]|jgi:DNA polymerase III delta prime subunit